MQIHTTESHININNVNNITHEIRLHNKRISNAKGTCSSFSCHRKKSCNFSIVKVMLPCKEVFHLQINNYAETI